MSIGRWAPMVHASPGVSPGFTIAPGSAWRFSVEIAPITSTNVDGSPQPVWLDVTQHVIDCQWNTGDSESESRFPVGTGRVRIRQQAFADIGGDPIATQVAINDRPGPGSLIRWGYYRGTPATWRPMFTGLIDDITEDWSAEQPWLHPDGGLNKWFDVECYDLAYYIAGFTEPSTYSAVSTMAAATAFSTLLSAIDFPAQYATNGLSTAQLNAIVAAAPYQAAWPLLQRIADTMGASIYAGPDGYLNLSTWELRSGLSAGFTGTPVLYVLDENRNVGFGTLSGVTILYPTAIRWRSSMSRMLFRAVASSPHVAGSTLGRSLSPVLGDQFRYRTDRAGWPKTDLLNTVHPPPFDADAAAFRSRETTWPDRITFDTLTAGRGAQLSLDAMIDWLSFYSSLTRSYQVQRRTAGNPGIFDALCTVRSVEGLVTCDATTRDGHRLIVSHGLHWW